MEGIHACDGNEATDGAKTCQRLGANVTSWSARRATFFDIGLAILYALPHAQETEHRLLSKTRKEI